jgi:hypothetical protein
VAAEVEDVSAIIEKKSRGLAEGVGFEYRVFT